MSELSRFTPSHDSPRMKPFGWGMWVRHDEAKKVIADLNAHIAGLEKELRSANDELDSFRCQAHGAHNEECVGCLAEQLEEAARERDEAVGMVRKLADRVDAAIEFIEDALEEGIEPGETRMRVEASTAVVWLSSMPSAQDDVKAARALLAKLTGGGE